MSAIRVTCTHCGEQYIAGVVGATPWPEHVCPDGTREAWANVVATWKAPVGPEQPAPEPPQAEAH